MTTTSNDPVTADQVRLDQMVMRPKVAIAGRPIGEQAASHLVRVVVDLHVGLPDMFELTFRDPLWNILGESGIALGTLVSVEAGVLNEQQVKPLIEGEVTSIEGNYGDKGLFHAVTRNKRAIDKYSYYSVFQPKVL